MTKDDIEDLLRVVEAQVVRARSLGGFSTEAESLMIVWEVLLKLTRHINEKTPRRRNVSHGETDD